MTVPRNIFTCADYPNPAVIADLHSQTVCATLLCRACLDEITCVAVMYLTLRTGCSRGRTPKVVRPQQRKNPLPFPLFHSGHMSAICARPSKGKGRFTRGWKPQVSTLLCARAASAQFRSLLKRHSPVRERSENHRVETAGVYPLAHAAGAANLPAKGWRPFYMRRKQRNRSLRLAQTAIVC